MIRVICDKCAADCGLTAYEIRVAAIHNPTPVHMLDGGELKITTEKVPYRFILCQHCYKTMGFPNYYEDVRERMLRFLDSDNK